MKAVLEEGIELETKGDLPEVLIVSGTHGDEPRVVSSVEAAMKKHAEELPSYLFIPKLSPSAMSLGTRKNKYGNDLNRSLRPDAGDKEALVVMELLRRYHFKTCFNFHEDPESSDFYVYDAFGERLENSPRWEGLKNEIMGMGVDLLNGIDDPSDPALGIEFRDGLHYFPNMPPGLENNDGMMGTWLGTENLVDKFLNLEVPGKIPQEKKDSLVDAIFRHLIL